MPLRSSIPLLTAFFAVGALAVCAPTVVTAQRTIVAQSYSFGQDGQTHAYKLATLPASNNGTYDHLHLIATLNTGDGSGSNSFVDATFGNRAGFTYLYSVRGATPPGNTKLVAYRDNSQGFVDIYLIFVNNYNQASYAILEAIQDTIYNNPSDVGSNLPTNATIVFDTSNAAYQPVSYSDFSSKTTFPWNLGIGTTNPVSPLHLRSPMWSAAAAPLSEGNGNFTIEGTGASRSPANGAALTFAIPANTDGSNVWDHGRVLVTADNNNNGDANGRMYLQTRFHSGNDWLWQNNLTLTSQGLVGIGTTSPGAQLGIAGGAVVDQNDNNPGGPDLRFGYPSGEGIGSPRTSGAVNQWGLDFYTGFTPRVTITGPGNVGIGTRTPSQMLEVNGNIKLSGGIAFPDGSNQWTAWTGNPNTFSAGTNANYGRITVGNSAPDGQGTASQGIVFVDSLNGSTNSGQWTHAAIYSVGESGFNGDLVFSTDGDGQSNNNPTEKMRIMYDGRVGIGTTAPSQKLEVNGNIKLTGGTGAGIIFADGSAPQTTAWTGTLNGGDYAESVDVTGPRSQFEPGDLLVIDPAHHGQFQKASVPYSTLVGGVFATKPGVTGRRQPRDKSKDDEVPMAMVGIVPTKVSAENGSIHDGDLLVSSGTPGFAMKGTDRQKLTGAVLGKALGALESGTGVIEVLISLQ